MTISINVKPNVKTTQWGPLSNDIFQLCISAPTKEGDANRCILAFLSSFFNIPKTRICIIGGEHYTKKRIKIYTQRPEALMKKLESIC